MSKALPVFLALVLAATATFLSVRPRPVAPSAAVVQAPALATKISPAVTQQPVVENSPATPWPQANSDIPADQQAVFGTLNNGFRYIIYPNSEPPKRVSFRLHIAAGSLMEADDQQGLAHFLEHMVFNGSENYKADELVPKMQHLGIGFGAHVNAFTSFDQTVYMLDLPDLSAGTVDLGFGVMRDFGDGALLTAEEIEKERGVILSEKMSRDSVSDRIQEQQFLKLLPESLVAKRFPIGQENVIKHAQRDRFTDFYQRYYIPQRMTFVVVGDVNPDEMRRKIEATFSSMKNPQDPGKNPSLGPVKISEGIETSVFADKELESTSISLTLVKPHEAKPDTEQNRLEKLPLDLAQAALSRRFERISKQANSAIAGGEAAHSTLFRYIDVGSVDVTVSDDKWENAVPLLEQEFRRAMQHGFTDVEISEAKAVLLNAYEQALRSKPTRKSESIATQLVSAINDDEVFSTPEKDLEIAKKGLTGLTAAQCHAAFQKFWDVAGLHLILTTKEKPEGAEKTLSALYQESSGKPVEAPVAQSSKTFAYTNFGTSGTVLSRKEIADLGITQLVLSNQVRVNLKPTVFEKDKIRLLARVGSGQLSQPKDMPMLDAFSTAIYEGGGLGEHSNEELESILAGRNVGTSFGIDKDAFTISGATTPTDFALEMQLLTAGLSDPGYREEGLWQFKKAIPMIYQQLKHTTAGPEQEMMAWLHGNDSRFSPAPIEKLSSYTIADAKKWLMPELTKGYLELSIVGDFQVEKILPHLLTTIGALPVRSATAPAFHAARKIQPPVSPAEKSFSYESKIPQGVATAAWKVTSFRNNQAEVRRLNVLAQIYDDRLRKEIREKLGASYSPSASAFGSDALENFGYLIGQSVGKPEDIPRLLQTMRELADKLAQTGASNDEFDRAVKPLFGQLEKSLRDNKYWLGPVLSQSQADPKRLDLARNRDADYRSITVEEINALAQKYLSSSSALSISIKPAEEAKKQ